MLKLIQLSIIELSLRYIVINNQIKTSHDSMLNYQDRGFQLGDGFFTTLRCIQGSPICFDAHYQRLVDAAQIFSMNFYYTQQDLAILVGDLIAANDSQKHDLAIRITVTRGCGERGIGFKKDAKPMLLITPSHLPTYPQNLRCKISSWRRSSIRPLCNIKHLGYQTNVLAYHEATSSGFDEAILVNERNQIVCTSRANIFLIKNDDCVVTPPLTDGCLPGITRATILKKFPHIRCESVLVDDLKNYRAAFATNSLCGMIPICQIDDYTFDTQHDLIKLVAQFLGFHHGEQSYQ